MSCPDLCTAAKCEELERRISALEQALELLEAAFEAHTNQEIPIAHSYEPDVAINLSNVNNELKATVRVDNSSDTDTVSIVSDVTLDIIPNNQNEYVFKVTVNNSVIGQDRLILPSDNLNVNVDLIDNLLKVCVDLNDVSKCDNVSLPDESNLKIDGIFQSEILTLTVADGKSQDTASIAIPLPQTEEHVESNLKIDGIYQSDILTLSVADGESQDTAQIYLPMPERGLRGFQGAKGDQGEKGDTGEPGDEMNCDQLEQEFKDCCDQILNALNNLSTQLDNVENTLNQEIKQVYEEVTIDITGTTNTNYSCEFPVDEDTNQIIPGYAESVFEAQTYEGKGLQGIHENLKLVNSNLDKLHSDICKAIDPISTITVGDLYRYCELGFDIDKSLYFKEDGMPKYTNAAEDFDQAVENYALQLISETKYGYLLENRTGDELITAPNNWITPIFADFSLIQGRINNVTICQIAECEPTDVVSIVASDKFIARASGKLLVLHFVTFDNYPKRSRNSSYWQVQIPAAKDEYVWSEDFELLRWQRGNCYAELRFVEFKNPVSGFFASKEAANSYFNAVLNLTTATEKNRVYSEHKTPQTAVVEQITRPYRAFIESVNSAGQAICHVKYVPPIEPPTP